MRLICFILAAHLTVFAQSLPSDVACNEPVETSRLVFQDAQLFRGIRGAYERVRVVFEKIYAMREEGIIFNPDKITEYVEGGTCSAKTLAFADSYAEMRKNAAPHENRFWNDLQGLRVNTVQAREEMVCRQIAFNTIEVVKNNQEIDYARNKVQSLANFHEFRINYASVITNIIDRFFKDELDAVMGEIPSGIYLVRVLLPSDNEKLEIKGHTILYIKENELGLYYDPNEGLRVFYHVHSEELFSKFRAMYLKYKVYAVRFYRIQRKFCNS
jgi:hypothetical protein